MLFVSQLTSIITTPFILFSLANKSQRISDIITTHTYTDSSAGDMCIYANFENVSDLAVIDGYMMKHGEHREHGEREKQYEFSKYQHSLLIYIKRNKEWFRELKKRLLEQNGLQVGASILDIRQDTSGNSFVDTSTLNMTNSLP